MHNRLELVVVMLGCLAAVGGCTLQESPVADDESSVSETTKPAAGSDEDTKPNKAKQDPAAIDVDSNEPITPAPAAESEMGGSTEPTPVTPTPVTPTPVTPTPVTPTPVTPTPAPAAVCSAGSAKEVEPNDSPATANELGTATTFCGSIMPAVFGRGVGGSACSSNVGLNEAAKTMCGEGANLLSVSLGSPCNGGLGSYDMSVECSRPEVDHVAFTLPADAKGLAWRASFTKGSATIRVIADGVAAAASAPLPFKPGKRYVFEITGGVPTDYVIGVTVTR